VAAFLIRRAVHGIVTLWAISTVTFVEPRDISVRE